MKIECRDLVKTYKTVQAMDGLTLTVPEGQILGLLGKNVSVESNPSSSKASRCSELK